jgi:transposase
MYREVTMEEVKEVVLLWLARTGKKRIAAQLGLDVKTVRRYVRAAYTTGLRVGTDTPPLSEAVVAAILKEIRPAPVRARGETWAKCEQHRGEITKWLDDDVGLMKCQRLLTRQGVEIPYGTLYRFAVGELGFGGPDPTMPVADGEPGKELQVDTGWMTLLEPDETGRRRRFKAFIFTPNVSRYRFVYPVFRERTAEAIEACEAAWEFYGGVFSVLIPDNTKAIVQTADPLEPLIQRTFLEYAQARGFHIDPARVRKPKDKGRVEKSVRDTREDCFRGELLRSLAQARERALYWSRSEYGMRRHSTTQRLPHEHFASVEAGQLLPAPTAPYDIPIWCDPKVGRDHLAQVATALYSLPTVWIGKRLQARADRSLVRFYFRHELIKTHPRQARGKRSIDPMDFPDEKRPYAMRDLDYLRRQASECGEAVGRYAGALLEGPLPWTRMRRVYALLRLVRRYGEARVDATCATALAHAMLNIKRLETMLKNPEPPAPTAPARALPPARYLRDPCQYGLRSLEAEDPHPPLALPIGEEPQGEIR